MTPPRTLPELFLRAVERYDRPDFMRYKAHGEFVDISAREFREEVELAAFGLISRGVRPGDRVAILSENRPGWALADLAALSAGAWSVPIYTSLTNEETAYILADSGAVLCFVSTPAQLAKVEAARARCPALACVVALDPIEREESWLTTARHLLEEGRIARERDRGAVEERRAAIDPADTASILYTSGTTGMPKGVMLSHSNFVTNIVDSLTALRIESTDAHLSFLPLSHSFERMAGYYIMIHAGVSIAYAESIETVAEDMRAVRPTVMTSVPRLYEKMYARVLQGAAEAGGTKKKLVFWARRIGIEWADRKVAGRSIGPWLGAQHRLADRLVYSKLRAAMGGRIRFFVSGSAPLPPVIARFFYAAGLPILEGYGLTETSPVITVNTFEKIRFGSVGTPIPNVEVVIEPDPERPGGDGEILVRGPNVMQGYYKLDEATAAVVSPDGWLRTGDIGFLDPEGFLTITDRKKDLIKTSGGKYVAPQPLENRLKTSRYVSQAVVVGNRRKYVSVLIVPNDASVEAWAKENPGADRDELYRALLAEINADLPSYGTLKAFRLLDRDFTIEAGELTPTLKVKRRVVEDRYAALIDTMYESEPV